ncbi:MAG TPA: hypothetical protein VNK70_01200 [Candidatus Paceibacterota bacterium]|nr:hypothetical protein [Candidatus Paceibacterota bacterium]
MRFKLGFIERNRFFWIVVMAFVVIFAGFYVLARLSKPTELPSEFLAARKDASSVSVEIVALTNSTNDKIKAVNVSDLDGNRAAARNLLEEARRDNEAAYDQAFRLSRNLQQMTESLRQVSSLKSQRLAYEAVSVELALVSEFISYTQALDEFLNALARALSTDGAADRRAVLDRLGDVNRSVAKINDLNGEFLSKISEFDRSL